MLPTALCALQLRNLIGSIKDVCVGTVFYARNIHRCAPLASQVPRAPPSPPDGLAVTDSNLLTDYMKNQEIKNIVVLAGAGISTPCGIPDFRTQGTGLYDNLQKYNLPSPESIFDMDYFMRNPVPFFDLAKYIYPGNFSPGAAHYFVKLLDSKDKLLRMYTQNIDGLERLAGINEEKLVEAHGTFSTATCLRCGSKYSGEEVKTTIFNDDIPKCSKPRCRGVVKPDIVFFGELMPDCFHLHSVDIDNADLMIIMGTSLVVHPFASLVDRVKTEVPRLVINRDMIPGFDRRNDIFEQGDVDIIIPNLANRLGWLEDFNNLMLANDSE